VDAPIGYIAATEHYCSRHSDRTVEDYWCDRTGDVEIHHFIGKDIAYFHILFWPAMLKAANYRTPDFVHVHGFLTVDSRKMSKSRGTFITARQFADFLNPWYLRYYYSTKLGSSIDDLDLNVEEFVNRTNAELVNNITNLISRTIGFLNKRLGSMVGTIPEDAKGLIPDIEAGIVRARENYEGLRFGSVTREILAISDIANNYVQHREPWSTIKADRETARNDLTFAVNCIKIITVLLKPILPSYCARVEEILGLGALGWDDARFDFRERTVGTFEKLLERLEPGAMEKLIEACRDSLAPKTEEPKIKVPEFKEEISIEDFARVDLRIGKVIAAEVVEGSDKLLKLQIDLGRETRTVFAGIKAWYAPEDLVNRNVVVVCNLKPRKMRFGISEGMVLAAGGDTGKAVVCEVAEEVPPGITVR